MGAARRARGACAFYPRTRERTKRATDPFLSVCVCVFVNFTGRVREILRPVVRGMRSRSFFFSFFAREPAAPFLSAKSHFKARADVSFFFFANDNG